MFIEMMPSIGGGGNVSPELIYTTLTAGSSFSTPSDVDVTGKMLIVYTWLTSSSSNIAYNAKDLINVSGGTAEKLGNFAASGTSNREGTVTLIRATSSQVSFGISSGTAYCQIVDLYGRSSSVVNTGTFRQTSTSESISVNTGLGSALRGFVCFGVSYNSYNIQQFVRWDYSLGNYFYSAGAYANVGGSLQNQAFTSTAQECCPVISSISNGVVSLVGCKKNTNWVQQDFVWWAW